MNGCLFYLQFQISKALAGADRKDLMRRLPKFIYDEEKALEVRSLMISHLPFSANKLSSMFDSAFE